VTLDGDVDRLLHEAMHESRRSFKDTLNDALRAALGRVPLRRPENSRLSRSAWDGDRVWIRPG